jgi:hypothetical protein
MTEHTSQRRGFIKGIAAGVAGLFFALRGTEPVQARGINTFPVLQVRIGTPDVNKGKSLSDEEWTRLRFLRGVIFGRSLTPHEWDEYGPLQDIYYSSDLSFNDEQQERWDHFTRILEGGNQTPGEETEYEALELKSGRLDMESELNYLYHRVKALRSVKLRPGEFAFVVVPYCASSEIYYDNWTYFRLPDGSYPVLSEPTAELEVLMGEYASTHGKDYIPPKY